METNKGLSELDQLIELLKEGHNRIKNFCENAVLLIGVTGEGKSTLCSAFGGHKLVAYRNEKLE